MSNTLHTMQAAIALSPVNKAMNVIEGGDTILVQEYAHEQYRIWIVSPDDIPVWAGNMTESDIDFMNTTYHVDPGEKRWEAMGIVHDSITDSQAIVAAIRHLAAHVGTLHTEIMVMKALIAKEGDSK